MHLRAVYILKTFSTLKDTDKYVDELVSPVLNCLHDPEVRVRLFASESLYNIVKVARGSIIPQFPRIFSALSRLVTGMHKLIGQLMWLFCFTGNGFSLCARTRTDSDENCKNGSELLDRLLKVSYKFTFTFILFTLTLRLYCSNFILIFRRIL